MLKCEKNNNKLHLSRANRRIDFLKSQTTNRRKQTRGRNTKSLEGEEASLEITGDKGGFVGSRQIIQIISPLREKRK